MDLLIQRQLAILPAPEPEYALYGQRRDRDRPIRRNSRPVPPRDLEDEEEEEQEEEEEDGGGGDDDGVRDILERPPVQGAPAPPQGPATQGKRVRDNANPQTGADKRQRTGQGLQRALQGKERTPIDLLEDNDLVAFDSDGK
jgi:hypothetical protein